MLLASLQANRLLSIKRVFPKNTANRSTEFALTTSTGFNVLHRRPQRSRFVPIALH